MGQREAVFNGKIVPEVSPPWKPGRRSACTRARVKGPLSAGQSRPALQFAFYETARARGCRGQSVSRCINACHACTDEGTHYLASGIARGETRVSLLANCTRNLRFSFLSENPRNLPFKKISAFQVNFALKNLLSKNQRVFPKCKIFSFIYLFSFISLRY